MKKLANEAQTPVTEKTDLKAQLAEVAERIRTMREIIGLSEEEMAQRTGVTLEEYRGFESGEHDFSFTFIFKCAERFGIDPTDLIKGTSPRLSTYTVTRRGEGLPITRRQGFKYLNLAPLFKGKTAEPFFVTMPYNEAEQKVAIKLSTHQGQEMDIVIKGKMRVQIGSHIEELGEGDSIYYNSGTPHGMIAVGGEKCTLYAVVMRPQKEKKPEKDTFEALIKAKQDRADRETVASPFVHTELDENGILKSIDFMNEEKFNFAFDIVDKMAEKEPDKLAMLWVSKHHEEKRFTFNDMKRMSNKTANYFKSLGIKRGDRVMLILKRHYQFWFAILALHKLGAVVIPATNLLMEHDLDYRFKAAGVRALVCTPDGQVADEALRAAKNCSTVEFLMMANGAREGWLDFDAEVEKQSDVFERTEDTACGSDPMLMFFTSGTTGYPKIAEHNYKYALGHYITAKYWHNVNPEGLHFTISDTGWGKALWGKLYGQWMCEAPIFTYDFDKFDAHDILPMFKQYNITTFCAPPTMYRFFIKEDLSKYDLSSIEYSTTAGEALNPEVYEQWKRATGLSIYEGFGQTETTLSIYNPAPCRKAAPWASRARFTMSTSFCRTARLRRSAKRARSSSVPISTRPAASSWAITATKRRPAKRGAAAYITPATPHGAMKTATSSMSAEQTMSSSRPVTASGRSRSNPSSWSCRMCSSVPSPALRTPFAGRSSRHPSCSQRARRAQKR